MSLHFTLYSCTYIIIYSTYIHVTCVLRLTLDYFLINHRRKPTLESALSYFYGRTKWILEKLFSSKRILPGTSPTHPPAVVAVFSECACALAWMASGKRSTRRRNRLGRRYNNMFSTAYTIPTLRIHGWNFIRLAAYIIINNNVRIYDMSTGTHLWEGEGSESERLPRAADLWGCWY